MLRPLLAKVGVYIEIETLRCLQSLLFLLNKREQYRLLVIVLWQHILLLVLPDNISLRDKYLHLCGVSLEAVRHDLHVSVWIGTHHFLNL